MNPVSMLQNPFKQQFPQSYSEWILIVPLLFFLMFDNYIFGIRPLDFLGIGVLISLSFLGAVRSRFSIKISIKSLAILGLGGGGLCLSLFGSPDT